jgi:putative membrane protein
MIRLILVVVLLTLSLTFFLQNREEEAILHYLGATSKPTPHYKPILISFGAGVLIMGILLFPAWIKLRIDLRRSRKALQLAEGELDRRRNPLGAPGSRPSLSYSRGENTEDDDVL